MTEIWKSLKDIVECGDNYEVSNIGRVRSIDRIDSNNHMHKSIVIKPWYDKDGYARATLRFNGKKKHYMIHRLVAISYIENTENKPTVNHKDGNKVNNSYDNLEWSTHKEQINHADEKGLRNMPNGEDWYNSKLTENEVREIFSLYKSGNYSYQKLADLYDISKGAISAIINRKSWKYLDLE